jgi:hypothetical protein
MRERTRGRLHLVSKVALIRRRSGSLWVSSAMVRAGSAARRRGAGRIGDAPFHEVLAGTVRDISEGVVECGGEIHADVGDEVIVT